MANRQRRDRKFAILKDEDKPDMNTVDAWIASAKVAAVTAMRICAPAITALHPVICDPESGPAPGTFAVDKYFRMYVCTSAVFKWVEMAKAVSRANPCGSCGAEEHHPIAYLAGAICHEAWHPMRLHFERAIDLGVTNFKKWNWATDEEINDDIMEIFASESMPRLCIPPTHLHIPSKHGHEDYKLAEHYYYKHMEDPDDEGGGGAEGVLGPGEGGGPGDDDHGSAVDGQARPWDLGEPKEDGNWGLSEAEGRMIRKQVAINIQNAVKGRGTVPGGWERWADKILEGPKYDWRAELRKAIRWSIARAQGDEERTYRRLGRRCASVGYRAILPSTFTPAPVVAVVQDTSGSMSEQALTMSISEAEGIIRAVGCEINWVACDMHADKMQSTQNVRSLKVHGGGGTDMRIGIKAALAGKPAPNVIVLFTDGYTPWPSEPLPKGTRLVVGLVGQHSCNVNEPPAWSTVVKIVGDDVVVRDAV